MHAAAECCFAMLASLNGNGKGFGYEAFAPGVRQRLVRGAICVHGFAEGLGYSDAKRVFFILGTPEYWADWVAQDDDSGL
jgi:hypothetical protein